MAQIGEIEVYTATGVQTLPIFELADFGADVYSVFKVYTPSGVGAIPLIDPGAGTADRPWFKVYSDVSGGLVLEGHSAASLAPVCPSYTLIDGFASSPGNFIAANFDNLYGSPTTNFTQVASPVPTCGESGQSLEHATTTASTCFSNASYWTAGPGSTIELFAQFSGTTSTYNIVLIYFGATSIGNTYRAFIDWGNSIVKLQKGGSDLVTAAITSRPTGQFCNIVIDYRDSSASDMTVDLLDDVNGTSLIGGAITSNDTTHTGDRVGLYVKSSAADPIYVNALRTVP